MVEYLDIFLEQSMNEFLLNSKGTPSGNLWSAHGRILVGIPRLHEEIMDGISTGILRRILGEIF